MLWFRLLLFLSILPCLHAEMQRVQGMAHPFDEWQAWQPMGLAAGYFSITRRDTELQLWFDARFEGQESLVRLSGPDLLSLKRSKPLFDTRLVEDYDRDLDGIPLPILTRAVGTVLADGSELVQASIGPNYTGGGSELYPVLFHRPANKDWAYLGVPAGEPAAFARAVHKAGGILRCESGGVVQLPDQSLRIYCHGMDDPSSVPARIKGQRFASGKILVADAGTAAGPWTFYRDKNKEVVDITRGSGLPWLFPHVQALGPDAYMLTGADQWPPKAIYAAYSRDGINFVLPVDSKGKPLPLRRLRDLRADALFCKTLRGVIDPQQNTFYAVMNVSTPEDRGVSMLYAGAAKINQERLSTLLEAGQRCTTE